MQKFIINQDGTLRFGHVRMHKDMLAFGERAEYGGGLWKADESRGAILLYGRSYDFGPPEFDRVSRIEWEGAGGQPRPLFYLPLWPDESRLEPVYAGRWRG